jgi:hypothetical protein
MARNRPAESHRRSSRGERLDAGARIETGPQSAVRLRLTDGALG